MRKLLLLAALLGSLNTYAAPASEESIERLLTVTHAESLIDSMYSGLEQVMRQGMNQAIQGKTLNADQQRALDALPAKFIAAMREEMSWQKMKPLYVQIYRDTFEQQEVDGLLVFYKSPTGEALLNKMPTVMQKTMALSQSLTESLLPKMTAAMTEALSEATLQK